MRRLIWRIKFTIAVMWIFRQFAGWQLKLGWTVSGKTKYGHLAPYDAALEEIGEWYE